MISDISILIIEDHPLIVEGYVDILNNCFEEANNCRIDIAQDFDSGLEKLLNAANKDPYDLLLIDLRLPFSKEERNFCGEDLAFRARHWLPEAKIMILSSSYENTLLNQVIKRVNPEAFLIKCDITSKELKKAIGVVLENETYYSAQVNNFLKKSVRQDFILDEINLKIIYWLSQGIKTKNLPKYIHLSLSAIEKRKNYIKDLLGIERGGDEELLSEARKRALI